MTQNHNNLTEIAKFDQLADEWWNPEGKLKTLHHLNPARLSYIQQHCSLINKRVLDVGCGGGILSEALAKEGAIVTAIDQSKPAIDTASEHAKINNLNIDYIHTDITRFAQEKQNHFDVIICMELLEHVDNPAELIKTLSTMLKPQGILFVSTLNRTAKAYALGVVAAEYVFRLLPKGTHDYAKFIKPSELVSWARAVELKTINISGLSYNPWQQKASIVKNVDINYLMCLQKAE